MSDFRKYINLVEGKDVNWLGMSVRVFQYADGFTYSIYKDTQFVQDSNKKIYSTSIDAFKAGELMLVNIANDWSTGKY